MLALRGPTTRTLQRSFQATLLTRSLATSLPARRTSESTPASRYNELIIRGTVRQDDHQQSVINRLQGLYDKLAAYDPPPILPSAPRKGTSVFSRLFHSSAPEPPASGVNTPHGLYLYGSVGTGKTMLMDLFYETIPSSIARQGKRRVHFHAFMIDVHKRIHKLKTTSGFDGIEDPIGPIVRDLANDARVLCFDEFQVTDIVDAMILRRLLEGLLQHGVVCVMTSNRHPDELYKNGIQRASFVPCIELIKQHYDVVNLDSGTDYRKVPRALSKVYFDPLNDTNEREFDKLFHALAGDEPIEENRRIAIWGRELAIPESTRSGVARFSFDALCGKPLSAADYIEIAHHFGTVFVKGVPKMGLDSKDKARRFITFIDACYESKTKLFALSEVPIHHIFSDDPTGGGEAHISDHMRSIMDDLGLSDHSIVGKSSMFSGEEEVFAFERACSRLVQMGTKDWAETTRE